MGDAVIDRVGTVKRGGVAAFDATLDLHVAWEELNRDEVEPGQVSVRVISPVKEDSVFLKFVEVWKLETLKNSAWPFLVRRHRYCYWPASLTCTGWVTSASVRRRSRDSARCSSRLARTWRSLAEWVKWERLKFGRKKVAMDCFESNEIKNEK